MTYTDNMELRVKTEIHSDIRLKYIDSLICENLLNHMKLYNSKCDL